MKKLIKIGLLFGLLLLFAGNAWALPIAGDLATMTPGDRYTLTTNGVSYNTFCVEKYNYFSYNGTYKIDSVEDYATGGGVDNDNDGYPNRDYISQQSLWLYASFYDGLFGSKDEVVEEMVQQAIWFMEDEIDVADNWLALLGIRNILNAAQDGVIDNYDFTVTGWDIKVANLVNLDGSGDRQSQLVGAPVPEPATMVLFGIGLLGLAGIGRKRTQK